MSYPYPYPYPHPARALPSIVLVIQVLLWIQFAFTIVQWGILILTGYAVAMGIDHTGDDSGFARAFMPAFAGVFMLMTAAIPQLAVLAPTIAKGGAGRRIWALLVLLTPLLVAGLYVLSAAGGLLSSGNTAVTVGLLVAFHVLVPSAAITVLLMPAARRWFAPAVPYQVR